MLVVVKRKCRPLAPREALLLAERDAYIRSGHSLCASGSRPGAAMVEMAILLPFVVFLFLVAVDFCRVYHCTQTLEGCARAGALYASEHARGDPALSLEEAARRGAIAEGVNLNPPLRGEDVAVSLTSEAATVTVSYTFYTLTGFPGLPRTLALSKAIRMERMPRAGQSP